MLFTLWGCIRYYGYVGVPIITHNFNSTSTVDHVLLLHLKNRDVIFGKKAIEIIANKLPDSYRLYLTRHNDELKKNAQAIRLAQARAK